MDTEDCQVHCIKPGGVAMDGAPMILAETAMLIANNIHDLDESDSFGSDKDLENDETVIHVDDN